MSARLWETAARKGEELGRRCSFFIAAEERMWTVRSISDALLTGCGSSDGCVGVEDGQPHLGFTESGLLSGSVVQRRCVGGV